MMLTVTCNYEVISEGWNVGGKLPPGKLTGHTQPDGQLSQTVPLAQDQVRLM